MPASRRLRLPLVLLGLLAVGGCDAGVTEPPRKAEPPPKVEWTVTHVLIAHKDSPAPQHKSLTRSKDAARMIATSLLAELKAGRSMSEVVEKYTDDHSDKKPNTNNGKPGSYTFGPKMMAPPFEEAAKATPVGQFAPEPVETPYGFHLVRRDR